MAKQTINPGTAPTGAGGDTFRSGSAKLQANDNELYDFIGGAANTTTLPSALPIAKGGTGATTAAAARTNLGLGTAATGVLTTSNTDSTVGRVLKVGDFGLGSTTSANHLVPSEGNPLPNASGFYSVSGGGNKIKNGQWIVGAFQGAASAGICITPSSGETYICSYHSAFGVLNEFNVKTTKNTTVDGNGFIKAASPIARLFADRVELNDEAQQQNIEFEKLGVGDYLIKGSSGFAQEGWYVETPKDANGNVLFSVIYTTLENGDISVKTYKKKFDFETVSIVADLDNPVDITENRWIDLRLQELPQPEIEEPGSIAPPEFQPTGLAQAVATVMESYDDPEQ